MLVVIIEYELKPGVADEFGHALTAMLERVQDFDGYLGELPCRASQDDSRRVTISYWRDAEALKAWRVDPEHRVIQERGRNDWLAWFTVRVLEQSREYGAGVRPGPPISAA